MSQLSTTISKLSIDSDNESTIGDVFIAKPKEALKEQLGVIAGIINMTDQPDEFVDKFFEVISDLEAEYYLPPFENEGGNEKRFEECLQRANRRINKAISNSVSAIDLKTINALIILNNKNKLYISRIGKNNAFLFHRKKQHDYTIVDIFSAAGEKKGKAIAEKMFSNIVAGSITDKDNLLFCSDNVLENLSQNELMEITTENTPASALKEIKKLLESDEKTGNAYAIIINPIITEEDAEEEDIKSKNITRKTAHIIKKPSDKAETQTSINRLISTQEDTEKFLAPSMAPNWKKALIIIWLGLKKLSLLILKYSKILIENTFIIFKKIINSIAKKINNRNSTTITKANEEDEPQSINIEKRSEKKIEHKIEDNPTTASLELPLGGGLFQTISNWLNQQITKFIALNKLQQSLLVIVFILVFFFSQSMVWQGRAGSIVNKVTIDDKVTQVEEYLNTAEAQNIFNDEDGAKSSLSLATSLIEEIPDSHKYKSAKEELWQRVNELEKTLQKIAYINDPSVISDLSNQNPAADVKSISKFENIIFAIDVQNQSIYKVDLADKKTTRGQLTSDFSEAKKIIATDKDNVLILNGDNQIYQYKFSTNEITSSLAADNSIIDFDLYGGKLYSLRNDQIFKHFPISSGYNTGSAWIKNSAEAKDQIAMAIDGGIYTIDNSNNIKYFLAGQSEAVNFTPLSQPLSSPGQMFSNIGSNYLYVMDQNNCRIVILDKNNGNLKIQYTSKEFTNIKSMAIEENQKNIYILSNQKIYTIAITF